MSSDMPDWLLELMPAAEGEEPRQKAVAEDRQVMPLRADTQAEPYTKPQEAAPADVDGLDDLRHQVAVQEAAQVMAAQKAHSPYVFGGLLPWQAFFLSVLLFLDVAIIGMLFLIMLGRIVP
ncbi:MAG TPA: hypothetical protein PLH19_04385 [Anaerolineae bacterium]|nr:hypothetical protein [Anaerolineae bacterium]HQH37759.1 hypothetical protein [Anaerolineae bacterium]